MADCIIDMAGSKSRPCGSSNEDGERLRLQERWEKASRGARGIAEAIQLLADSDQLGELTGKSANGLAELLLDCVERADDLGRRVLAL